MTQTEREDRESSENGTKPEITIANPNADPGNGDRDAYKLPAWDGRVYPVSDRFFGMLGLCRRAGKTVLGTEMICSQMRAKNKPVLVFIAISASEGTREKIIGKCRWYGVPYTVVDADGGVLARHLGKKGFTAAVAVMDPGLASAVSKTLSAEAERSDGGRASKGRGSPDDGDGSDPEPGSEYGND